MSTLPLILLDRPPSALRCCVCTGLWLALTLGLTACAIDNPPETMPAVQRDAFDCAVQPILAKQCSMPACHGNALRRFRVLAPGRMRIPSELVVAAQAQSADDRENGYHPALTELELQYNFMQARSMIVPGEPLADCPLLNRPLAVSAGGMYHVAGGDIFPSKLDPEYLSLKGWLLGYGKELCK